ncbi:MAG: hypothetical protein ACE5EM_01330 [Sphingomonadales bacterium]
MSKRKARQIRSDIVLALAPEARLQNETYSALGFSLKPMARVTFRCGIAVRLTWRRRHDGECSEIRLTITTDTAETTKTILQEAG